MACIDPGRKGDKDGYGTITIGGKFRRLHRKVYADHHGLDLETMGGILMHTCDNPRCINVEHLKLGTTQSNVADRQAKGRQAKGMTCARTKHSDEVVAAIRAEYYPPIKGVRTSNTRQLSEKYGVSVAQVHVIAKHKGRN